MNMNTLEEMKVQELIQLAIKNGVKWRYRKDGKDFKMKRDQLVEALQELGMGKTTTSATVAAPTLPNYRTLESLTQFAHEWFMETYGKPVEIPIELNGRIKSIFGRFHWKKVDGKRIPEKIDLSKDMVRYQSTDTILDVLKHELVHYYCFISGLNHRDGQQDFENELKRLNVCRTGAYRYKGMAHEYACDGCGRKFHKRRRYAKHKENFGTTTCCHTSFTYNGEVLKK